MGPGGFALCVDACGPAGVPGAGGPGRCVCRWAAARPRDRHTRACGSEWSISRPALALPPPTGTAARPCVLRLARALRTLRRPPHQWGVVCWRAAWRVGSKPGQALPLPVGVTGARTLSFWDAPVCVVTNVVNPSCLLCGLSCACYKCRQSDGIFAKNSGFWPQIDDVCNTGPQRGLQNAPV